MRSYFSKFAYSFSSNSAFYFDMLNNFANFTEKLTATINERDKTDI